MLLLWHQFHLYAHQLLQQQSNKFGTFFVHVCYQERELFLNMAINYLFVNLPETNNLFLVCKMYTLSIIEGTKCLNTTTYTCIILCASRRCSVGRCTSNLAYLQHSIICVNIHINVNIFAYRYLLRVCIGRKISNNRGGM